MTKFADQDDVVSRFEGEFPSNRLDWVDTTIGIVERALMGRVPSLRKTLDNIKADSVAVGDPDRPERVTDLVCYKVLDLYRNPNPRLSQTSQTMEQDSITHSFVRNPSSSAMVTFTDDELAPLLLPRSTKPRIGTFGVTGWGVA